MTGKSLSDNFLIRKYQKGDFDGISKLWILTDMSHPVRGDNEETIESTLKLGGTLLILENKLTGLICGTSWMTFDGRRVYLHHFGIHPEFQGNGLSKLLLQRSLDFARKKGRQIKLEVNRNNIKAIELYRKAGFIQLGDFEVYIIRDLSKINV